MRFRKFPVCRRFGSLGFDTNLGLSQSCYNIAGAELSENYNVSDFKILFVGDKDIIIPSKGRLFL